MPSTGYLLHFLVGHVDAEHGYSAMIGSCEVEVFLVGAPRHSINAVVPVGSEVDLGAARPVHDEDAVFVGLIAVMLHRYPGNLAAP